MTNFLSRAFPLATFVLTGCSVFTPKVRPTTEANPVPVENHPTPSASEGTQEPESNVDADQDILDLLRLSTKTSPVEKAGTPPVVYPPAARETPILTDDEKKAVASLCDSIDAVYKRMGWGLSDCNQHSYSVEGWTTRGRPILTFSAGEAYIRRPTLIQCGIHGDELSAVAMCFRLINEIEQRRTAIPHGAWILIQPLLNADGFLSSPPQRTNANGVDINRNFLTHDWNGQALAAWKKRERSSVRKFPGAKPNSEKETLTIVHTLERSKPEKIIAIHTPLGFLDLDGRGDPAQTRRAKFLAINMSHNAGNYTFRQFGFYPGSLGNYAGNERLIPVYTLELPQGDGPLTIQGYWQRFRVALWRAIAFNLNTGEFRED